MVARSLLMFRFSLAGDLIAGARALSLSAAVFALASLPSPPGLAEAPCDAPAPVCDARAAVFSVSAFDPYGSAVRIATDLLVTSRHIVADEKTAEIRLDGDRAVVAEVVPTAFTGDLVLLRADLPAGPVLEPAKDPEGALRAVGQDIDVQAIRVFPEGRVLFYPDPARPYARLHHTAHTQPGTSGGALLDEKGGLAGIVASGGEGRYEAIPAARIARLMAESGPEHAAASAAVGAAYRECLDRIDAAAAGLDGEAAADALTDRCRASGNRQLLDLAAQALGRARLFDRSARAFEEALDMDPNAVNTRLGYVVTLVFARRFADAEPHVRWLVEAIPHEPQVHRYAVQVGKFADAPDLAETGLDLIARHNPAQLEAARKFLAAPVPGRLRQQ